MFAKTFFHTWYFILKITKDIRHPVLNVQFPFLFHSLHPLHYCLIPWANFQIISSKFLNLKISSILLAKTFFSLSLIFILIDYGW